MIIKEALAIKHCKEIRDHIITYVGNDPKRFTELFDCFMDEDKMISQRASWALSHCVENHPKLIDKHFGALIKNLNKPDLHDAIKRNSIRLLQFVKIPEKFEGSVYDLCFKYMLSAKEAVAVRSLSINILAQFAKDFPELREELIEYIYDLKDHESGAIRSRAKHALQQFKKLNKTK